MLLERTSFIIWLWITTLTQWWDVIAAWRSILYIAFIWKIRGVWYLYFTHSETFGLTIRFLRLIWIQARYACILLVNSLPTFLSAFLYFCYLYLKPKLKALLCAFMFVLLFRLFAPTLLFNSLNQLSLELIAFLLWGNRWLFIPWMHV